MKTWTFDKQDVGHVGKKRRRIEKSSFDEDSQEIQPFEKLAQAEDRSHYKMYPKLFLRKSSTRESNEIRGLETFFFLLRNGKK